MVLREWFSSFLLSVLALTIVCPAAGELPLRVDESATQVRIGADSVSASLRVENPARNSVTAYVLVELVYPDDSVRASTARAVELHTGWQTVELILPLTAATKELTGESLYSTRLRYRVAADAGESAPANAVQGVVALSQVSPDLFRLDVITMAEWNGKAALRVRVRATHSITHRPIGGVQLKGALDVGKDADLTATGVTDAQGYATLSFQLPAAPDEDGLDLTVTGKLGAYEEEAEGTIYVRGKTGLLLSTDKALYQPGQTLHLRALAFGPDRHAVPESPLSVKITDPEGTLVFRTNMKTSKFGIASADWQIPVNLRLGDYEAEVSFADDVPEARSRRIWIKVSRYDLPNFTVAARPDREFYLAGQNATIEVRADYLFGQPVAHGHVRVVRETERQWNYREQKWELKQEKSVEGELDADHHFVAKLDLSGEHAELAKEDYRRFEDLDYTAYLTDLSTGRTEEWRFRLRVTKDPIHIYVVQDSASASADLPLEFYVSTSYADGRPARCEVSISDDSDGDDAPSPGGIPLLTLHTNSYGLARVKIPRLNKDSGNDKASRDLAFRARDPHGALGFHSEYFYRSSRATLRVSPNRSIFATGDRVELQVASGLADSFGYAEAVHDAKVIATQRFRLRAGRAFLVFPANDQYSGVVTFSVCLPQTGIIESRYENWIVSSRTVFFPGDDALKLDLHLDRASYRPGDPAQADLRLLGAEGRSTQGALGLVVFDKAIEERLRTDGESVDGRGFYAFRRGEESEDTIAGISVRDLVRLDRSAPISDEMDVLAEVLGTRADGVAFETLASANRDTSLFDIFSSTLKPQSARIHAALATRYAQTAEYPKTAAALRAILAAGGVQFDDLRDPWGTPFRAVFEPVDRSDQLRVESAGPDKKFGTDDDFTILDEKWPYFRAYSEAISRAVREYHARTSGYIRDHAALKSELLRQNIELDALRDPWGHAYRFTYGIERANYSVQVESAGPDGRFSTKGDYSSDDVQVTTVSINYFDDMRRRIAAALEAYKGEFPHTAEEFSRVLHGVGIEFGDLRDPWGRPYYVVSSEAARYEDRRVASGAPGQAAPASREHNAIQPITRRYTVITVRSMGPIVKDGPPGDFDVATFSGSYSEQSALESKPRVLPGLALLYGSRGAITGQVTDPAGAVIVGAAIHAVSDSDGATYDVKSGSEGDYLLGDLPAGQYTVVVTIDGFKRSVWKNILVRSSQIISLDVRMELGEVSTTVEVAAGQEMLQTTQSAMISRSSISSLQVITKRGSREQGSDELTGEQLSTPRLREYFPETVLWQPEIVTDSRGRAQIKFPLADSLTTWKMQVIGSTLDGRIATAEKEFQTFQPFFAELDPPKTLTQGDEIALPIVVRNYLNHSLDVSLSMKPENWFSLLSPASLRTQLPPNESKREVFSFRADASIAEGNQRLDALAASVSDAIQKKISVHPDGEERTLQDTLVFLDRASLNASIPADAISGSARAELKIYPNLMAHVVESIEGILHRPYGCGEQTISSTYPSLLLLRALRQDPGATSPLRVRAERYLRLGYERLLGYRAPGGGFSYWGRGEADLALTAYAARFLEDARNLTAVDDSVIHDALNWLLSQARSDGSWPGRDWQGREDPVRTLRLTAYIARTLAESQLAAAALPTQARDSAFSQPVANILSRSLEYLEARGAATDDPYLIATYALAAYAAKRPEAAALAVARLRQLAREEHGADYWNLESNTLFYGWGIAGRVETTALVLQALAAERKESAEAQGPLVSGGILFLLRNKDRYGVWYSTQATVNVDQALITLVARPTGAGNVDAAATAQVIVNGQAVSTLAFPKATELASPLVVDLSGQVRAGENHVEIRRSGTASPSSAQLVVSYYVPWPAESAEGRRVTPGGSEALRYAVHFSKIEAHEDEPVECTVEAERVGFHGYGMMLAEVGLPPRGSGGPRIARACRAGV